MIRVKEFLSVLLGRGSLHKSAIEEHIADYEIEKGSNERGSWIKYASGRLVQKGTFTSGPQTLVPLEGVHYIGRVPIGAFPVENVGIPKVKGSYSWLTNLSWGGLVANSTTNKHVGDVTAITGNRTSIQGFIYEWESDGFWKI